MGARRNHFVIIIFRTLCKNTGGVQGSTNADILETHITLYCSIS